MADYFQIEYLFDLYPDVDFTEEWVLRQTIEELPNTSATVLTSEKWGDVRNSTRKNRKIQSQVFQEYEVKILCSRNIGFPRLEYADFIQVTRLISQGTETFYIYDVTVSYAKVTESMNYVVTLTFKQERETIINHLLSSHASYWKGFMSDDVNEIQYDVDNPAFSFNNIEIYSTLSVGLYSVGFKIPLNKLSSESTYFSALDTYWLHTDNSTFNESTMPGGDNYSGASVIAVDTDYVYFFCYAGASDPGHPVSITIPNLIIDHVSDGRDWPAVISTEPADRTMSVVLYTFLEPEFGHVTDMEPGNKAPANIQENQAGGEKDICKLKVWLSEDNKWKAEYLRYALFDGILISLANYDDIIPGEVEGIITENNRPQLLDVLEYDILIKYNNKALAYYR